MHNSKHTQSLIILMLFLSLKCMCLFSIYHWCKHAKKLAGHEHPIEQIEKKKQKYDKNKG